MRTLSFPLELDGNGELLVVDELTALRQKVDQRLSLFKGTWIIDINAGVPYLQDILKKPVDPGLAASILGNEILKEDEVTSLGEVTQILIQRQDCLLIRPMSIQYTAPLNHLKQRYQSKWQQ